MLPSTKVLITICVIVDSHSTSHIAVEFTNICTIVFVSFHCDSQLVFTLIIEDISFFKTLQVWVHFLLFDIQ